VAGGLEVVLVSELAINFGVIGAIIVVVGLFVRLVASMLQTVTGELVNNIRERLRVIDDRLDDHAERIANIEEAA
jgi:F0F1-type ATP synthase membrane subunit b/b'